MPEGVLFQLGNLKFDLRLITWGEPLTQVDWDNADD
jgi:hypothetical protein